MRTIARDIADFFGLMSDLMDWSEPRFNIAPTQSVLAVRQGTAGREPVRLRWGLIPTWAKDASFGAKCINARSEEVAESRVFGRPFRRSRCLIVTDGFYEWEKVGAKKKVPILFTQRDESLFAFAGLMDCWTSPTGEVVESCSILTTSANELLAPIHHRMPVILPVAEYDRWLNPPSPDVAALQSLLVPYAAEEMRSERVSDVINNVRNEVDPRATPLSSTNRNRTGRLFADDDPH